MKKLKLAVIGPGLIGKKHIELIKNNKEVELDAIIAPDTEENRTISNAYKASFYTSLKECVCKQKIDGVIICSPNEYHYEQAKLCMYRDIPVLIEKPITVKIDDAEDLVKISIERNSKVMIGHHRSHSPLIKFAKEILLSNKIGNIVTVQGSAQFYKPDDYFLNGPWRKEIGGGPILINLIHEIGVLRELVGEIIAVQSISTNKNRNFIVEDTVSINLIFENGALGSFLLSDVAASPKSWEQTSGENNSYANYANENCYIVTGDRGSISIPSMRVQFYQDKDTRSWNNFFIEEFISVEKKDPLECQLQNFISVIKGKDNPIVNIQDGYRNLLITNAIRESASNGNLLIYI